MRPTPSRRQVRLGLEHLEDRITPATVDFTNGTLTVLGDDSSERINVTQSGGTITAAGQSFASAEVNLLIIDAGSGDDTVSVSASVKQTAWIFGGAGNDVISSGGGQSFIFGSSGNDTITGGSSRDVIYGGTGTDSIAAPAGAQVFPDNPYVTATPSAVAQEIVRLTNQFRAANGLGPLNIGGQLTAWAALHSQNMVNLVPAVGYNSAMAHTLLGSPQPTMQDRAATVGYEWRSLGENIAYGFPDAASVVNAWINSAGHRANMLNPNYTDIGVAVARTDSGLPYYTEVFGQPAAGNPITPPPPPTPPPTPAPPPSSITVTQGFGGGPTRAGQIYATATGGMVAVYDMASGAVKFRLQPYSSFTGDVRIAIADVTGDGRQDIITAPSAGMAATIKIFDGVTGNFVRSFTAYDPGWWGGAFVAAGDVNGDGRADIITGADAGGGPHVKVFDGRSGSVLYSFFAYVGSFHGGVRVAVGDVNGDGKADIITAPGPGMTSQVEVFSGATGSMLENFTAYDSGWQGGAFVAAGDLNGDGRADIVTGADAGGGPHVKAFNGLNLAQLASFFTEATFSGGVRVAIRDVDGDGKAEIVTAQGRGGRTVRLHTATGRILASFLAGDATNLGGAFIG